MHSWLTIAAPIDVVAFIRANSPDPDGVATLIPEFLFVENECSYPPL